MGNKLKAISKVSVALALLGAAVPAVEAAPTAMAAKKATKKAKKSTKKVVKKSTKKAKKAKKTTKKNVPSYTYSTQTMKKTRTINLYQPKGIKKIIQNAYIKRSVKTDVKTKKKTYGKWSTSSWMKYKVPAVKGYNASKPSVDKAKVTSKTKNQTIKVTYKKVAKKIVPSYTYSTQTMKKTRTIKLYRPDGTTKTIFQNAYIKRSVKTDVKTKKKTYGKWSTSTWEKFNVPEFKSTVPGLKNYTVGQRSLYRARKVKVTSKTKDQYVKMAYVPYLYIEKDGDYTYEECDYDFEADDDYTEGAQYDYYELHWLDFLDEDARVLGYFKEDSDIDEQRDPNGFHAYVDWSLAHPVEYLYVVSKAFPDLNDTNDGIEDGGDMFFVADDNNVYRERPGYHTLRSLTYDIVLTSMYNRKGSKIFSKEALDAYKKGPAAYKKYKKQWAAKYPKIMNNPLVRDDIKENGFTLDTYYKNQKIWTNK
ncbi:mucin-binding protein [Lactobacillus equicursoris]|uniref:mucin-binding protein n=1 Tax=Lactobacillus equicursoris TaxID=420645 RepID=UPI003994F709